MSCLQQGDPNEVWKRLEDGWGEYPMNAICIKRIYNMIHRHELGDFVLAKRRDCSGASPDAAVQATFSPILHEPPADDDDGVHVKHWGVNPLHGMLDIVYCVDGVKDSPYEGFKFDLCLTLNSAFPFSEIRANFCPGSIPYHPSIHPISGRVCADVLTQEGCSSTMGPYKMAVLIRSMLGDFNCAATPDLPFLNADAAALLANDGVTVFRKVARAKCIARPPIISVWEA